MKIVRVIDVAEFDATLAEHFQANGNVPTFCCFFGSEDPGTGESWCPDCVVADPLIRKGIRKLVPSAFLFECPVGDRALYKGNASHPYRVHPQIRLQAVPQLMCWTSAGPTPLCYIEEQLHTEASIETFLRESLAAAGLEAALAS